MFCLVSCGEGQAGSSVLDDDDMIQVCVDTFKLSSAIIPCDSIISWPDSFMLGELANSYGIMHADIMTQLACPEGFAYPQSDSTRIDSIVIYLCYRSCFGDDKAPLSIDVQRMDKGTFVYHNMYATNLDPRDFVSEDAPSILMQPKIVVSSSNTDSISSGNSYVHAMHSRCSDEFVEWFSQKRRFTTQADFNQWFKGLYITSSFGGSTVFNISDIFFRVYYSFSYLKGNRDTVVQDVKDLYANAEVRQVNVIRYDNKNTVYEYLQKDSDLFNYVLAPANMYTRLTIPMDAMSQSITQGVGEKRPYVNMAKLRLYVGNVVESKTNRMNDAWAQPVQYMLLVKESAVTRFFMNKELPMDTCALLASLSSLAGGSDVKYYYEYDLSSLLTNQLRHSDSNPDVLNMVAVPVDVQSTTNSNGTATITSVKQQQTLSATVIYSARNTIYPLSLEVIYSGF